MVLLVPSAEVGPYYLPRFEIAQTGREPDALMARQDLGELSAKANAIQASYYMPVSRDLDVSVSAEDFQNRHFARFQSSATTASIQNALAPFWGSPRAKVDPADLGEFVGAQDQNLFFSMAVGCVKRVGTEQHWENSSNHLDETAKSSGEDVRWFLDRRSFAPIVRALQETNDSANRDNLLQVAASKFVARAVRKGNSGEGVAEEEWRCGVPLSSQYRTVDVAPSSESVIFDQLRKMCEARLGDEASRTTNDDQPAAAVVSSTSASQHHERSTTPEQIVGESSSRDNASNASSNRGEEQNEDLIPLDGYAFRLLSAVQDLKFAGLRSGTKQLLEEKLAAAMDNKTKLHLQWNTRIAEKKQAQPNGPFKSALTKFHLDASLVETEHLLTRLEFGGNGAIAVNMLREMLEDDHFRTQLALQGGEGGEGETSTVQGGGRRVPRWAKTLFAVARHDERYAYLDAFRGAVSKAWGETVRRVCPGEAGMCLTTSSSRDGTT